MIKVGGKAGEKYFNGFGSNLARSSIYLSISIYILFLHRTHKNESNKVFHTRIKLHTAGGALLVPDGSSSFVPAKSRLILHLPFLAAHFLISPLSGASRLRGKGVQKIGASAESEEIHLAMRENFQNLLRAE